MYKPLIFYFVSMFLGCLSALFVCNKLYLGAVITASFLLAIFLCEDLRYFLICLVFFICGFLCFKLYYSISIPQKAVIRVTDKKGFRVYGSYKGRTFLLKGAVSKIDEGSSLYAEGKFENDKDFSRGIVGSYYIKNYSVAKEDFISRTYKFKRKLYDRYEKLIGEDKAGLVMSLCFGDTSHLSKKQKNDFQNMGVIHAVSVSGMHLSLIYLLVEGVFGLTAAVFISTAYVIFTGTQSAAVRSLIMIITARISKKIYKNYDPLSSISFAGLILLVAKPCYITDIGFSLSFLATFGILLYYKRISSILFLIPEKINESLSLTFSAQIFTLPYISFTIQKFSWGFILGNFLLLPLYSAIVIVGNIGMVLYKFTFLFTVSSKIAGFFIDISDEVGSVILDVSPGSFFIGCNIGIAIMLMYFSYILYKHGFMVWKWFPVFMWTALIFSTYAIVPEIKYIRTQYAECIYVKYRFKSVMISNYEITKSYELENILQENPSDKIITNAEGRINVRLYDKFIISRSDNDFLKVISGGREVVIPIRFKNIRYASENKQVYDIMKLKSKNWIMVSGRLLEVP